MVRQQAKAYVKQERRVHLAHFKIDDAVAYGNYFLHLAYCTATGSIVVRMYYAVKGKFDVAGGNRHPILPLGIRVKPEAPGKGGWVPAPAVGNSIHWFLLFVEPYNAPVGATMYRSGGGISGKDGV